jgi:hypothetical protein
MDFTHLIESEGAKLEELHAAINRTVVHRDRDQRSRREWEAACAAFHNYVLPLDRYLEPACDEDRYTDRELLEFAIRFLELDPWFFRSGYLKQILITRLKRSDLDVSAKERLRRVLIDAVNRRGTPFRAGLRSSLHRMLRVASRVLVSFCVAALRDRSRLSCAHLPRAASLPNNSLVPTLETKTRFVSVSSGAAQLKR